MALFSCSVRTHPFADVKVDACHRVTEEGQIPQALLTSPFVIFKENIADLPGEVVGGGRWKIVPKKGSLFVCSGAVVVKDLNECFFINQSLWNETIPIPIHDHYDILVPENVTSLEKVYLNAREKEKLDGWLSQVTGSIKIPK